MLTIIFTILNLIALLKFYDKHSLCMWNDKKFDSVL